MADDADLAQAIDEVLEAANLLARRQEGPLPTGWCLYCEEPVEKDRRWCAAECRDSWQECQR